MNAVERVKSICKERKIAISKLESDCGFANGYIGQLRKGTFPDDRLRKIASYLNVSSEFLSTGKESIELQFSKEQALLDLKISKDLKLKNALEKYFSLSEKKQSLVIELINLLSKDN